MGRGWGRGNAKNEGVGACSRIDSQPLLDTPCRAWILLRRDAASSIHECPDGKGVGGGSPCLHVTAAAAPTGPCNSHVSVMTKRSYFCRQNMQHLSRLGCGASFLCSCFHRMQEGALLWQQGIVVLRDRCCYALLRRIMWQMEVA